MASAVNTKWHSVWNKRKMLENNGTVLEKLIAMDGFDTPLGLMLESDWRVYVEKFAKRLGITSNDSLFEVGCGSGAFLYPFYEVGQKVGGIDFSLELINMAKTVMANTTNSFQAIEAAAISVLPQVDVIIANHVIHYFPDLEYSKNVFDLMLNKARKNLSISGIPDALNKEESEVFRKGMLSQDEYEKKYDGLPILYYESNWFEMLAKKHGFNCYFYDHEMPGFAQNKFRFDCIMQRK